MKLAIVLIPGMHPEAARPVFDAIKEKFEEENFEIVELERANDEELDEKIKNRKVKSKILIGKSLGGRVAVEHQLEYKDAEALVLLAPAVEARDGLKEIEIPVLIIHGTEDTTIPIENSRELKKYFKNCKLVEIPDTDHAYRGKEKEVAKLIAEWLNSF